MLLGACRDYRAAPGRLITFEYILIKGINDSQDDARRLAKILRHIRSKINLIPFNSHEGCDYERPDDVVIAKFQEILIDRNYTVMIRQSKGQDISAACGQLRARSIG
jgi:23S rRNA (adenine2503-C2)-methyltransferase